MLITYKEHRFETLSAILKPYFELILSQHLTFDKTAPAL